jgi:hypothetical protein
MTEVACRATAGGAGEGPRRRWRGGRARVAVWDGPRPRLTKRARRRRPAARAQSHHKLAFIRTFTDTSALVGWRRSASVYRYTSSGQQQSLSWSRWCRGRRASTSTAPAHDPRPTARQQSARLGWSQVGTPPIRLGSARDGYSRAHPRLAGGQGQMVSSATWRRHPPARCLPLLLLLLLHAFVAAGLRDAEC